MSATFLTLNNFCQKNRCSDDSVIQQNSRTYEDELLKNNNPNLQSKLRIRNLVHKLADQSGFGLPAQAGTNILY